MSCSRNTSFFSEFRNSEFTNSVFEERPLFTSIIACMHARILCCCTDCTSCMLSFGLWFCFSCLSLLCWFICCTCTYAEVAAAACGDGNALRVKSRSAGSQGPRCRAGTKGGVSSSSEDKGSDSGGTGPHLRTAGRIRGPVVGSGPGRCARGLSQTGGRRGAVTPYIHLGVRKSLSVTPGRGKGLRQQLGWMNVCEADRLGVWVLKGDAGSYTLPFNLDHLSVEWTKRSKYSTAWVTTRLACLCSYKYGRATIIM